jgi:EAL domain-containing protein (putative c-di-GMP-specific phosphodiesterase class I)/DNA-binding NarL/FixJ family response regulator
MDALPPISTEFSDLDLKTFGAHLKAGLERSEFTLLYQPTVDVQKGNIIGVGALLRWDHPRLGPIEPARFIPLAERLGLMIPIGDWVLDTACAMAAKWQRAGYNNIRMTVNVSVQQLVCTDFSERIARLLDKHGLEPGRLGIEVREQGLATSMDQAAAQLGDLRAMAVEIAIDNFGTGQSSLNCLRRLPIDVVKIDRSLIREMTSSSEALSIARAIIAMAHSLHLKALAEGVESEGQLELLAAAGCDNFQGYHFSAPVHSDDIERMLLAGRRFGVAERRSGGRPQTILIVDNDQWVLDKLREQIGRRFRQTVRVETFCEPKAALRRVDQGAVDVVICALRMKDVDGMDFLNATRSVQPLATRMMLLGRADIELVMSDKRQLDVFRYLSKPWVLDQTLTHLEAGLEHAREVRAGALLADTTRLVQYEPGSANVTLAQRAERRRELRGMRRGPLGEVVMPLSLPTLPGDLWTMGRIHG